MLASRVLICGDRTWGHPETADNQIDRLMIIALLDGLYNEHMIGFGSVHLTPFTVIEGVAKGADSVAHWWAKHSPCHSHNENLQFGPDPIEFVHLAYPADWEQYGKAAGPVRNRQMLKEGKPDLVVAFHDDLVQSEGTKDMVKIASEAGVATYVVGRVGRPLPQLF